MEAPVADIVKSDKVSLKQIFKDNWHAFITIRKTIVSWYVAYTVWKVINCREPDGLGFQTFACPVHADQTCIVPNS